MKETKELIATFEVNTCNWGQDENFCANVSLSHGYDIITSDVICNELFITEKDGKRYLNFDKPE